jgi:hypothetical protein
MFQVKSSLNDNRLSYETVHLFFGWLWCPGRRDVGAAHWLEDLADNLVIAVSRLCKKANTSLSLDSGSFTFLALRARFLGLTTDDPCSEALRDPLDVDLRFRGELNDSCSCDESIDVFTEVTILQ